MRVIQNSRRIIDIPELVGAACTLNGHAARITRTADQFAKVACLDMRHGSATYSWEAVQSTMAKGGKFAGDLD